VTERLPAPPPAAVVAVAGTDAAGIVESFERLGHRVLRADQAAREADLVVVLEPTAAELAAGERALKPGGTLALVGEVGPELVLRGSDLVLEEAEIIFLDTLEGT
jgi:D-arabinose 1-dehydrogenase-like Zn-dependent alcohol dehydrogenase